jgi:hypothetical protein
MVFSELPTPFAAPAGVLFLMQRGLGASWEPCAHVGLMASAVAVTGGC